jgi:cellulose synthase/poly-beta-1,6-N-acetylglucosamine synthase-like glycosyltransferase
MWNLLFALILVVLLIPFAYFVVLAVGAAKDAPDWQKIPVKQNRKFIVAIAAHNEASVIENTVRNLYQQDYPQELFRVYVVADHCTDETADLANRAGAVVYQREGELRGGKGAALSWLFDQIWQSRVEVDAIAIFDADTVVDQQFLQVMNARLESGEEVIQGKHIIANPHAGWFPLLTWTMFIIDNRFQNQGRVNLGFSAKHMGDTICFRSGILKQIDFGTGLTEDYELRQKLLLCGYRIAYEPGAVGYGEAPKSWKTAERQRSRWLRGVSDANKNCAATLLRRGIQDGNGAMIDGALQSFLPSFSTVTLVAVAVLAAIVVLRSYASVEISPPLIAAWTVVCALLLFYPIWGLMLERAPIKAYLILMTGPLFILWRSWVAFKSRYIDKRVAWVRTPHGT